jgi:L-iditol 2-dehydrogenase
LGFHRDGGYAEFIAAPVASLIPVPPDLPGHLACLGEPLGCALNALDQLTLSPGMTLLLYGGGTLGLLTAMAARTMGIDPFVVETNGEKLRRSERFRKSFGIVGKVACNNSDFDAVINATTALTTLPEGLSRLKSGGRFSLFSGFPGDGSLPVALLNEIHYRQLHLVGAYGCTRKQMALALNLLRGAGSDAELLIEECINLDQVPAVFPAVLSGGVFKFVVVF